MIEKQYAKSYTVSLNYNLNLVPALWRICGVYIDGKDLAIYNNDAVVQFRIVPLSVMCSDTQVVG